VNKQSLSYGVVIPYGISYRVHGRDARLYLAHVNTQKKNKQSYHLQSRNGLPGGVTSDLLLSRRTPLVRNGCSGLLFLRLPIGGVGLHSQARTSYDVDGYLKEEAVTSRRQVAGLATCNGRSRHVLRKPIVVQFSFLIPGWKSPGFLLVLIMAEVVECISLAVRVPGGRHGQRRHQVRSVPRQQGWFPVAILSLLTVQFRRSRLFMKFNGKIS